MILTSHNERHMMRYCHRRTCYKIFYKNIKIIFILFVLNLLKIISCIFTNVLRKVQSNRFKFNCQGFRFLFLITRSFEKCWKHETSALAKQCSTELFSWIHHINIVGTVFYFSHRKHFSTVSNYILLLRPLSIFHTILGTFSIQISSDCYERDKILRKRIKRLR